MITHSKQPVTSKNTNLLKSSMIVGIVTMLSRILGMIRDFVIASSFGTSASTDAFFLAFKIPNFLRRVFAEGAFSQAFLPVLAEYQTQEVFSKLRYFIQSVCGALLGYLSLVTILGMLGAPWIIKIFAPGFLNQPEKLALAQELLFWVFPYLLFISMSSFLSAILNSFQRFALPAFTYSLLNISMIISAILFTDYFEQPIFALAVGVLLGGFFQMTIQFPLVWKLNLLVLPRWNKKHKGVKRVMKLMLPVLFGASITQISLVLDAVIASFLETGSVSWLYYSERLLELPIGVFAIAIGTVILPNLSKKIAKQSQEEFSDILTWGILMVIMLGAPASVALFILAKPLMTSLFFYGNIQKNDILMSSLSLQAYSIGLVSFMGIKVLLPGFISRKDTRTPVRVGIMSIFVNLITTLMFVFWLHHAGIALGTSIAAIFNSAMLLYCLKKNNVIKFHRLWLLNILKIIIASAFLCVFLFYIQGFYSIENWFLWSVWERLYHLSSIVFVGIFIYFVCLLLLGLRIKDIKLNS